MRRFFTVSVLLLATHPFAGPVRAELLAAFDLTGYNGDEGRATSTYVHASFEAPAYLTRGPGLQTNPGEDSFRGIHWTLGGSLAAAISNGDYFAWTLTPGAGTICRLSDLTLVSLRTATGPTNYALRCSHDNFSSDLFAFTDTANHLVTQRVISLAEVAGLQNVAGPVEFRLYAWGAGGNGGGFQVQSPGVALAINGVAAEAAGPILSAQIDTGGGCVYIRWASTANSKYLLQTSTDVGPGASWTNVAAPVTATNPLCSQSDILKTNGTLRFYRIVLDH